MKTVYFMRPIGQRGPIKIGCSATPAKRLRTYEIWSPVMLEIIAFAPGSSAHENYLHHKFASHRLHGEWFEATADLVALVDSVAETGALPPLEIPTNPKEWKAYHEERKGNLPRRDNAARLNKYRLTKRVHAAEQRAFGFSWRTIIRPDDVAAIIESYQGFGSALPTEKQVAVLEKYISRLDKLPKADRSRAAWNAWLADREIAA